MAPTLPPPNLQVACRAALQKQKDTCKIWLTNGGIYDFRIVDVMEDALLGNRVDAPNKACLVSLSTICMIEFG